MSTVPDTDEPGPDEPTADEPTGTARLQESGPSEYARQVRLALSDLPPPRLAELLDDLDEHLAEVAADSGRALEAELGPPSAYAAELRRAAGLPDPGTAPAAPRLAKAVEEHLEQLRQHSTVRAGLSLLHELRPAQWVAWAVLALLAVYLLLGSLVAALGIPLVAAAVVLSMQHARRVQQRRPQPPRRQRFATGAGTAGLALLAVLAAVVVQQGGQPSGYAEPASSYPADRGYAGPVGGSLAHEDGSPITNVFPYSRSGEPLTDVLLYDQDGRALDDLATITRDGEPVVRLLPPGAPPQPMNAYPQQQAVQRYDDQGNPLPVPPVPALAPQPDSTPPVTPSPTTTSTPTPGLPPATVSPSNAPTSPTATPRSPRTSPPADSPR